VVELRELGIDLVEEQHQLAATATGAAAPIERRTSSSGADARQRFDEAVGVGVALG
jgi:hypothetical protein